MAIRILDANTIGKISAGEVVERPSSVVKELMENSLDAGATSITVEIKDGGISYLRVTDNGCGIPFNEARLAFENHATSKLRDADGLWDLNTLGFRGEALPSIAAVSRVTMTTRTKDAEYGAKVEIEGGTFQSISQAGCPEGTTFVMRDLFYNLPVRRVFLKKPSYEQGLITDIVQKMILGNPHVSFKLISSGKTLLRSVGDGDLRHAALAVYGRECALNLRQLSASEGAFTLKGLIGVGDQARPTRGQQCFFLNGRMIRCPLLSQALEEVCRGRVTVGMYPMCALSVTAPSEAVDINVHPSKLEVRFRDEGAFRLTAQSLLSKAFAGEKMIESFSAPRAPEMPRTTIAEIPVSPAVPEEKAAAPEKPEEKPAAPVTESHCAPRETPFAGAEPWAMPRLPGNAVREGGFVPRGMFDKEENAPAPASVRPAAPSAPKTPYVPENAEQAAMAAEVVPARQMSYQLIGVLFKTYILLECDDRFIMIDQHAAHERLNFEDYKRRLDAGSAAQQLLVPYLIHVSRREADILLDSRELLLSVGYEIEPFGDTDIQVRSVPFVMGQADMRVLFTELIESLDTLRNAEKEKRIADIMQASCKHAVKGGESLTDGEIRALVQSLLESDAPPTCPHGRPIMRVMTRREIERMFKRVQ